MSKNIIILTILIFLAVTLTACQQPDLPPTTEPIVTPPEPTQPPVQPSPTPTDEPETQPSPTPSDEPESPPESAEPLYLNLTWHQHQPRYYVDPETGIVTRPWVRAHATKDYYDMVAAIEPYPNVKFTVNLTPVLIEQLDAISAGTKDIYWVLGEKLALELTEDEKRFILTRFFDANWQNMIPTFPRYLQLLDKRGGNADPETIDAALANFTEQDFRDLQILWNLVWVDPDILAQEPLKSLVEKGQNFGEADKEPLFSEIQRIVDMVIPKHKELQDAGRIEVITTPLAHPILPLIFNSDLALIGDPTTEVPAPRFAYPNDGIAHLERARQVYDDHFGRLPVGLWPAEGAVAQDIVGIVDRAGFEWMATGEDVLASSLGMTNFARGPYDVVEEPDLLYRPYLTFGSRGSEVSVFFRDRVISDKIGFNYGSMSGDDAAQDFMDSLRRIKAKLEEQDATGPHIVSVILDGENAWEYYENDGKDFFDALYTKLNEAEDIKMVTPTEYLEMFPEQVEVDDLHAGAWFSPDFGTWIGEPEETEAWNYLRETREFLADYDLFKRKHPPSPEALEKALEHMYNAEGSDWFWWYGADQDSGDDGYFDVAYRAQLAEVYKALEQSVPDFVQVPIVSERAAEADRPATALIAPSIDGQADEDAWATGGRYGAVGGSQARSDDIVTALYYGFDKENLYLRLDARESWDSLGTGATAGFYLRTPGTEDASAFTRMTQDQEDKSLVGFGATHLIEVDLSSGNAQFYLPIEATGWTPELGEPFEAGLGETVLETAIPLSTFPPLQAGDPISLRAVISEATREVQMVPTEGPAAILAPDLSNLETVLEIVDPTGDDHGPGSYIYPTDAVFQSGVFDLERVVISLDPDNDLLVTRFDVGGPIANPWGAGNGLSPQTFDLYVDVDPGEDTGCKGLYKGRNAALGEGFGWEWMFTAEGWEYGMFACANEQAVKVPGELRIVVVDPVAGTLDVRAPLSALPEGFDPGQSAYLGLAFSQEGAGGDANKRGRVRDVVPTAEQWLFGGAPVDTTNHTRIIDASIPGGVAPSQEEGLSDFEPSQDDFSTLPPEAFGYLPMVLAGQ